MKQKKSPVPLISALVVIAAVAFVAQNNFKRTYGTPEELQQRAMEDAMAQQAKNKPTTPPPSQGAEQLAGAIGKAASSKPSADGPTHDGPDGPEAKGQQILEPEDTPMNKPKPNDSSVSTQWWK